MAILKIAKPGVSVSDAEKDLVFTSGRNCSIELFEGYVDVTTDEFGYGQNTFTHNLGYRPQYFCFVRDPLNTENWYPNQDGYMGCSVAADTTKLYFTINYKEVNSTYRVRYSIHANQLENGTGTGNSNVSGKLRIAKPGFDASTETDARNMKFFSGKNVYKVDSTLSGSTSLLIDDFINFKTITHNLGYVPMVFILNDSDYDISDFGQMLPSGFGDGLSYYINSTEFVIIAEDLFGGTPPHTKTFKYKILRDKIA